MQRRPQPLKLFARTKRLRHLQPAVFPAAARKFTVERMIESEGGAAVEEEDEHTVMFVVFTPGLLIRATRTPPTPRPERKSTGRRAGYPQSPSCKEDQSTMYAAYTILMMALISCHPTAGSGYSGSEQTGSSLVEDVRLALIRTRGPSLLDTDGREVAILNVLRSETEGWTWRAGNGIARAAQIADQLSDAALHERLMPHVIEGVVRGAIDSVLLDTAGHEEMIGTVLSSGIDKWIQDHEQSWISWSEDLRAMVASGELEIHEMKSRELDFRRVGDGMLLRGASLASRIGDTDTYNRLSMRFIQGMISRDIDRIQQFLNLDLLLAAAKASDVVLLQQLVDADGVLEPKTRRQVEQRIEELRAESDE